LVFGGRGSPQLFLGSLKLNESLITLSCGRDGIAAHASLACDLLISQSDRGLTIKRGAVSG
jgi:hypothetical protein